MNIRKIEKTFLQSFIGGVWYFRFPCFNTGPDWYNLFRSRIVNIRVTENGGLEVELNNLPNNRFVEGKWVYHHQTNEGKKIYRPKQITRSGKPKATPDLTKISETIAFIEIDELNEAVLYSSENEEPDVTNCFANFPLGFETLVNQRSAD